MGVSLAVGAVSVLAAWYKVMDLHHQLQGHTYSEYFEPGVIDGVDEIRRLGCSKIYGPSVFEAPYLCQRMSELLYPIEYFQVTALNNPKSGDICILPPFGELSLSFETIFSNRTFRLVRVK